MIIGTTRVIPYFTPFLCSIPAALILLPVNPVFTIIFVVFMMILQRIDSSMIHPKIIGEGVGLSALWSVSSLILFEGMFGMIDRLAGAPLFSVIHTLMGQWTPHPLAGKNLSTENTDDKKTVGIGDDLE